LVSVPRYLVGTGVTPDPPDAAFALEHGELTGKAPTCKKGGSGSSAFDEAVFDRSMFDTESVIWIELTDPSGSTPADVAALA
jgi:hypothetical protein